MLRASVKGAAAVIEELKRLGKEVPNAGDRGLRRAAFIVEAAAKRQVSGGALNVDKGGFRSSIFTEYWRGKARIGPTVIYARIHEFGGVIKPVKRRFLVFMPRGSKTLVFARRVTIPARAPMRRALDESRGRIGPEISGEIQRL